MERVERLPVHGTQRARPHAYCVDIYLRSGRKRGGAAFCLNHLWVGEKLGMQRCLARKRYASDRGAPVRISCRALQCSCRAILEISHILRAIQCHLDRRPTQHIQRAELGLANDMTVLETH